MKKYLITLMMLATLGTGQCLMAQNQQPKDDQELVDSTQQDALEAYSDTTGVADSTVVSQNHRLGGYTIHSNSQMVNDIINSVGIEGMAGMVFALIVLVIIFILSPLVILGVVLFFVFRNRKQKMKLAEMAMKQGQPIPDQLLVDHKETDDELWQKGLRQTFLGVGLLAFFGYVGSTLGIGIGILVTVIGLGKLAIVKTSKKI